MDNLISLEIIASPVVSIGLANYGMSVADSVSKHSEGITMRC